MDDKLDFRTVVTAVNLPKSECRRRRYRIFKMRQKTASYSWAATKLAIREFQIFSIQKLVFSCFTQKNKVPIHIKSSNHFEIFNLFLNLTKFLDYSMSNLQSPQQNQKSNLPKQANLIKTFNGYFYHHTKEILLITLTIKHINFN